MAALVYHTGALGDFLTAVPALRYWKKRGRGGKLILLGKPAIGKLAEGSGLIDGTLDADSSRFLPLFTERLTPYAEKILSSFQTAILFSVPDSPVVKNVRKAGIPAVFWQPPFPLSGMHAIDYHLSLFTDPSTISGRNRYPSIRPSGQSSAVAEKIIPRGISPVAFHPGSGSRIKNWPFERFLRLAGAFRKKGTRLLWLLGPAEENGFNVPPEDIVVSNKPLSLCAALLSRCRAFVGNDSGMAHLSAAAGCHTVVIFGPSDPAVWAPRGKDVRILYKKISCSPCHRTPAQGKHCSADCLMAITVDDVLRRI